MRVLVVDDHEELLDLVQRSLARDAHEVRVASTGAHALVLLERQRPELVVLDLGLTDMSGEALCRTIRQGGSSPAILVLTAQSAVASRVRCLDAGADDYLTKPFAVAELRARVRALARRAIAPRPAAVRRGDVRLDFVARRAFFQGEEAPITAREWALLELMAARETQVVRRDELLEAIWNRKSAAASASLEVLIGRIRRKLGPDLVRTVRGEGYALSEE